MKKIKQKLLKMRISRVMGNKSGMELVQVAILIAIAVALGIIFKSSITSFVNDVFDGLDKGNFS